MFSKIGKHSIEKKLGDQDKILENVKDQIKQFQNRSQYIITNKTNREKSK